MQKIKWLLVAPVLALLLAATPGGFPSKPTFQTVTVNGTAGTAISVSAAVTGTQQQIVANTSTLNNDTARYIVQAGSSQIQIGACNQNQTSLCKTVGGPSAAGGYIETFGAIPLVFGTGNNYAGQINTTQQLSMGAGNAGTARNFLVIIQPPAPRPPRKLACRTICNRRRT